jgi:hypothetical protein
MSTIRLLSVVAMVAILTGCARGYGLTGEPAADNRPDAGRPDKPSAFPTNAKDVFYLVD